MADTLKRSVLLTGVHLPEFLGVEERFVDDLERQFPFVQVHVRDHVLTLTGPEAAVREAERAVLAALDAARDGTSPANPDGSKLSPAAGTVFGPPILTVRGRSLRPQTAGQRTYVDCIAHHTVVFGVGPAGTGKTFLAIAMAVDALQRREVSKIVLTRPAVEAGERLGYLPGSLEEKIDPYLRPLFDALGSMLDPEAVPRMLESGAIEVAPLAYMRGRTLNESFVILDEAQNTTPEQMKMFLTRLGYDSKMVVTGDPSQVDLPRHASGLRHAQRVLRDVDGVAFATLSADDIVRNPLVARIVDAYDAHLDDEHPPHRPGDHA